MKVEVDVLAPVPNKPAVSVDVKQHSTNMEATDTSLLLACYILMSASLL